MLDNKRRRDILNQAKASNFKGSVVDLYAHASRGGDVSQLLQPEQDMMTANTPEQQEVGLREQHAQGNTGASMTFPNVEPNAAFNTKGMKVPIDITKYDEQGHLVQSFKSVPPGVESLPTGPAKGTVVETPAYRTGGYKGKYQTGGSKNTYAGEQNLDVGTSDGRSNYRKAYQDSTIANMQDVDGEVMPVFPNLDTIELSNDGSEWGGGENFAPKDWMNVPMTRSSQNQQYMRGLYKNNPVAQGAMKNTTGDSGDLWGNIMEGTKDAGLVAASTMAPIPGIGANPMASRLVNSMVGATKAELAGLKAGYQTIKGGQRGLGALKTLYHGTKLKALPMSLPVLGNYVVKSAKGTSSGEDLANAASVGVNMYNPFSKFSAAGKFGRYAVENSKDIVKSGISLAKGKYMDAASYLSSTFVKNKNTKMLIKTGNKARKAAS